MVRHDMQKANEHVRSEQIRLKLGLLTPAERAAVTKREEENERKKAKEATKGNSLFDE